MKTFVIRSIQKQQIKEQQVVLPNDHEAMQWALAQSLQVISIKEKKNKRFLPHKQRFSLLIFCQECHALLEAGLTIPEVLETLAQKEIHNPNQYALITSMQEKLREGKKLSEILSDYPRYFPHILIASIKASEQTGAVAEALQHFIDYEKQTSTLTQQIKSALIYPCTVLIIGSAVILFLLAYVLPKFATILNHTGSQLPYLSQKLLDLGSWISVHKILALSGLIIVIATITMILVHPLSRQQLRYYFSHHGPWQEAIQNYQKSRFFRALSMLLGAGIPLIRAIQSTRSLLNSHDEQAIDPVIQSLQEGQNLATSLKDKGLSDPIAHSLISIGEKSGTLSPMLLRSALFHEEAFRRWIDHVTRIAEPVIMTTLGLVVGGIVVLMYMPIFNLASGVL